MIVLAMIKMATKFWLVLLLGASCVLGVALTAQPDVDDWEAFKLAHGKSYESRVEESLRKKIFLAKKQEIEKFNAEQSAEAGYKKGLSHLSDRTEAELRRLLGFKIRSNHTTIQNTRYGEQFLAKLLADAGKKPLPESVDWRQVEGRVTPVKDQGDCGSCWAFSTTGLLEGQQLKVTGRKNLTALSEQNLVDCVDSGGCGGNWPVLALHHIFLAEGIDDALSYPYNAKQNTCAFNRENVVMTDRGATVLPQDEQVLKAVVAEYGPVSVSIAAADILNYKTGIFKGEDCPKSFEATDHAVLIVGYGTDPKEGDYWIVKNSWSSKWGEEGYIRMARNRNTCGITVLPVIAAF